MIKYKICAIIVTYYPNDEVESNFKSIYKQVDKVVIVDNTPAASVSILEKIQDNFKEVKIIYNKDNLGIAKALNQGAQYAIEHQFDWILTMDQDSTLSYNMVQKMLEGYLKILDKDIIWAITPSFLDKNTKHLTILNNEKKAKAYNFVKASLTSGMLIKTSAYRKLGNFNEPYFIYHVDTEYCFRANLNNLKLLHISPAVLYHSEGSQTRHKLFWKKNIIVTNHSPTARYYITRNLILLLKKYLLTRNFFTILKIIKSDIIVQSKLLLFETNRKEKIRFSLKGFIEGVLGKKGSIN